MTTQRLPHIDMAAGLMVLWIILGHTNSVIYFIAPDHQLYYPQVFFFAMFWFFYKSGSFFTKRAVLAQWKKDQPKLLGQFLFWSSIGYAIYLLFRHLAHNLNWHDATYNIFMEFLHEGHIQLNMPLWFLLTLFLVRQVGNCILPDKADKDGWIKCLLIAAIAYAVAFACYHFQLRSLPLYVANSAAGLAYFALGYGLNRYADKWWLIVPCAAGYIACCVWGFPGVGMRENVCLNDFTYLITLPASFCGIVTFNAACRMLSRYLHWLAAPFAFVGRYAMTVYASHGIIYASALWLFDLYQFPALRPYILWLLIAAYLVLIPIFYFFEQALKSALTHLRTLLPKQQ